MVQCPVCNEVCEVPNNEIDVLPVDHARQHLVKFFKVRIAYSFGTFVLLVILEKCFIDTVSIKR